MSGIPAFRSSSCRVDALQRSITAGGSASFEAHLTLFPRHFSTIRSRPGGMGNGFWICHEENDARSVCLAQARLPCCYTSLKAVACQRMKRPPEGAA